MNSLQGLARKTAEMLGRDSWLIRRMRPTYESLLAWSSLGAGISWPINGVPFRINPRHRHRLGQDYDAPVAAFLRERVRPGAVCFDVGANVGVYVLQLAHWSRPDGRIVAFEPNPGACAILRQHVALNGLNERVEIVPAAVGAAGGQATLFATGADGMSRLAEPNQALATLAQPMNVSVVTLDSFSKSRGLVPDWLVLDIEGFEIAALIGARELVLSSKGKLGIIVEMHPNVWSSANTTRALAEGTLSELGMHAVPLNGQADPLGEHGPVFLECR